MKMITWKQANKIILNGFGYASHVILGDHSALCLGCFDSNKKEIISDETDLIEEIGQNKFNDLEFSYMPQWIIFDVGSHLEKISDDDALYCIHCYEEIMPVYG